MSSSTDRAPAPTADDAETAAALERVSARLLDILVRLERREEQRRREQIDQSDNPLYPPARPPPREMGGTPDRA